MNKNQNKEPNIWKKFDEKFGYWLSMVKVSARQFSDIKHTKIAQRVYDNMPEDIKQFFRTHIEDIEVEHQKEMIKLNEEWKQILKGLKMEIINTIWEWYKLNEFGTRKKTIQKLDVEVLENMICKKLNQLLK